MDSILFKKSTHVSSENFVTFVQEKKVSNRKKNFLNLPNMAEKFAGFRSKKYSGTFLS